MAAMYSILATWPPPLPSPVGLFLALHEKAVPSLLEFAARERCLQRLLESLRPSEVAEAQPWDCGSLTLEALLVLVEHRR